MIDVREFTEQAGDDVQFGKGVYGGFYDGYASDDETHQVQIVVATPYTADHVAALRAGLEAFEQAFSEAAEANGLGDVQFVPSLWLSEGDESCEDEIEDFESVEPEDFDEE